MSAYTQELKGLEILNAAQLTALRGGSHRNPAVHRNLYISRTPHYSRHAFKSQISKQLLEIYIYMYIFINIYVYTHAQSFHHFTLKKPPGTTNYF